MWYLWRRLIRFIQAQPGKTHLKWRKCSEGKHGKRRLSGLAAADAYGEELPIFVIGKSKKPRCSSGIKHLPCWYRPQAKSWVSGELFEKWLYELDNKFHHEGRKVVMIIDNCPAHPHIENLKAMTIFSLPKNTPSITQPIDQSVIWSLKVKYWSSLFDAL